MTYPKLETTALLSLTLASLVACTTPEPAGSEAGESGSEDTGATETGGEAEGWQLPEVWGVETLEDLNPDPDIVEVEIEAAPLDFPLSEDKVITMLAYNGTVPGPLLQAKVGDEVIVHFRNALDEPTTVHWHGLRIPAEMDGNPRIQDPVEPGEGFEYRFVVEEPGSYWYHPHVRANIQVEKGLQAPITVHDPEDPVADLERYIMLDDILLENGDFPPFLASHPEQMHGRFGNYMLINGNAAPAQVSNVEQGTVERWRIVNTANARTMELSITGAKFRVVATDGGRIADPYATERIQVAIGQRYDLEVVYDEPGTVELLSHVLVSDGNGGAIEEAMPMLVAEVSPSEQPIQALEWAPLEPEPTPEIDREETLIFDVRDGVSGLEWTLNGETMPTEPLFEFQHGETVRLTLQNDAGPEHPFHLHGQFFTIVDDGRPETHQPGRKDTVLLPGLSNVEIIATMDNPGEWMAHCHILEHAELGMMGEIIVHP
jgi:FtsP/CotA-like multicopper oxidase with cupredoxin domain